MASRDYYRNLSRRLSWVMDDIGVNEEGVMSRRINCLIVESLQNLSYYLNRNGVSSYNFGSQTEGTTTDGLKSDADFVIVNECYNLIQDLTGLDWMLGKANLLMVQDERFAGYCRLQLLKVYGPYPADVLPSDKWRFDEAGRVILLHHFNKKGMERRHGPAETLHNALGSSDVIRAIRCKTWPKGYKMWSTHPRKGPWPTPEMISYMENSGFFVVPVAHRLDEKKSESWRISTSLAERCLMFSLNITQVRCYTLIKMIVKTFIDPVIPDVISSYICKNLLFYCIENTRQEFWQESNLLRCVNQLLLIMLEVIRCMNCPNYFNESINLLLGKVNKGNQVVLMGVIWKVLVSEGGFLAEMRFDNINELIHNYEGSNYQWKDYSRAVKCKGSYAIKYEIFRIYGHLSSIIEQLMRIGISSQPYLMSLQNDLLMFACQGPLQYVSATLLFPFLCSHLATIKASEHILRGEMLSNRTSLLYERSLESDMTSTRLKFASYLVYTGQFGRVNSVLTKILPRYDDAFVAICGCDQKGNTHYKYINTDRSQSIKYNFPSRVSMCVLFSQAERHCCPRELQYEMYRATEQEKLQRNMDGRDNWMDLACIDSYSYSYFLLYITSRSLKNLEISSLALEILKTGPSLVGSHSETVYNLLGQCYEYENRFDDAFACYCKSLRLKPTNNAARWHIVLLLNTVYQNE